MSWFQAGYEAADHAYDEINDSKGPRRAWMPPEVTNRYLFLEDEPFCFFEHQFQANGTWKNWEPCKTRNNMENTCAVCDRYPDRTSSFIGYHSVINLTPWTSKKGTTYCYGREMYGAKLGGKDNPGVLKELQRLRDKHGGHTRGLVIDCFRSGKKTSTVGDKLEVVDKIDSDAIVAWVKNQIAEHLEYINKGREPEKIITMEKFLSWNPIEPFNFEEIIKPRTNAQLLSILGAGSSQDNGNYGDDDSSALDDDIPY